MQRDERTHVFRGGRDSTFHWGLASLFAAPVVPCMDCFDDRGAVVVVEGNGGKFCYFC